MTQNEIITDILNLLYVNELVAENFLYTENEYQKGVTQAELSGLVKKSANEYQLTEKGIAIVESGSNYDDLI